MLGIAPLVSFLIIATIISSFFIRSHPVFVVIGIILLGIFTFMNAVYSDIYHEMTITEELASTADEFGVVSFVMDYYPFMMVLGGAVIIIILYSKLSQGDI